MQFSCPHCHKSYEGPPTHAGKKAKCKRCQQVFVLTPAAVGVVTSAAADPEKTNTAQHSVPATVKQLRRAKELGLSVTPGMSKAEVNQLLDDACEDETIEQRANSLPPTYKQLRFAKRLGIAGCQSMTRNDLSAAINTRLDEGDPPTRGLFIKLKDFIADHVIHRQHYAPAVVCSDAPHPPVQRVKSVVVDDSKKGPRCQLCGGAMKKKKLGRGFLLSLIINLLMLVVGILVCFTGIGIIIGIPMILIALFRQNKRQRVLMCVQCGAAVNRA